MAGEPRMRPGLNAARHGEQSLKATIVWWVGLSVLGWTGLAVGWKVVSHLL